MCVSGGGSVPGLRISPGEGNDSPLQYFCFEHLRDRGAWWAIVHGVTNSWTLFSNSGKSVQSLSRLWLFATPWIAPRQASLSITNSWSLPKVMSIKSVMSSSHLILCCSLLLLPAIPPSIRVFSNESTLCMRWPILEFQLQHQSFQCTPRTDLP